MSQLLKQSTTVTLKVGPFLDATDGVSEETGITPVVELAKGGGAFGARSSATAITHDAEGWFDVELNATDTGTLGRLVVKAHDSATHLPVWHEFMVVPANVYDSLISGSDNLETDPVLLDGGAQSMDDLKDFADAGYDPATNKVEGVKLVDTTTTNTDMRGTDSALLASSAPTNFADMAITVTTGQVTVGTSNDKTGYSLSTAGIDAILDEPITEPSAVFAWGSATLRNIVGWLGALARNKKTQTATTSTLRNDADAADIATSTVSDDGTTFTSGEWT